MIKRVLKNISHKVEQDKNLPLQRITFRPTFSDKKKKKIQQLTH